jgi:hypothetical protein
VHVVLTLINQCDLLVALCGFVFVVYTMSHLETLLKKLQTVLIVTILVELHSNKLIDTHKVFRDFTSDVLKVAFNGFLKSGFKIVS